MSRARSRSDKSEQLKRRQAALRALVVEGGGLAVDDCVYHVNLDDIDAAAEGLWRAFPYTTLHALRVDAAPCAAMLQPPVGGRFGLRADSPEELRLALACCPADRVVAGGGYRDAAHLERCLSAGVTLVIDSLQELRWLEALLGPSGRPAGPVLLGVNAAYLSDSPPQREVLSGIDLSADRAAILAAFRRRPFLRGLALSASPAWSVDEIATATRAMVDLAGQIEQSGNQVSIIDLGDCLATAPEAEEDPPVQALIDRLATAAPELMLGVLKGRWRLQTGAGARVFERATSLITRVASTRRLGSRNHAWCPAPIEGPCHEVLVHAGDGGLKRGAYAWWEVHGPQPGAPLLSRRAYLPPLAPGDLIWLNGMPSPLRTAPPCRPAVYGCRATPEGAALTLLAPAGMGRPAAAPVASSISASSTADSAGMT